MIGSKARECPSGSEPAGAESFRAMGLSVSFTAGARAGSGATAGRSAAAAIDAGPVTLGFGRSVAEVIEREFGVKYHPGHVWYVLRAMGWSCQKPERRARERDEPAVARWRKQDWSRIKKKPAAEDGASC